MTTKDFRPMTFISKLLLGGAISASIFQACGGEPFGSPPGGDAGQSGSGGAAGSAGGGGSGGASGDGGDGGESGGDGGDAGSSGEGAGGSSGSSDGGESGGSGTAGASGQGGESGSGGDAGSGGSKGECGTNQDCADENACNGEETCKAQECKAGEALEDGTVCETGTDAHFCQSGECVPSVCGDAIVDPNTGEQCDDGNDDDEDGCTGDCEHTCTADADCDDEEFCSGTETCVGNACKPGDNEEKGVACTSAAPGSHVCDGVGACVLSVCGDGFVDPANQEECEDLGGPNGNDDDGCTDQCQFTCEKASDCSDADVCTGLETCGADHVCKPGTPLNCNDNQACTTDSCHPTDECQHVLRDADGDGFADEQHGACTIDGKDVGGDCNDANAAVNPGVTKDACNSGVPPIDDDCDGTMDEDPNWEWYADCDKDLYPAKGAEMTLFCGTPKKVPSACASGSWTFREPVDDVGPNNVTTDCRDTGTGAASYHPEAEFSSVTPVAGDWDFNCDGNEEKQYPSVFFACDEPLMAKCPSDSGWTSVHSPSCGSLGELVICEFAGGPGGTCTAKPAAQAGAACR